MFSIIYYVKRKEARRFIQIVVFPLPIALFIAIILFAYGGDVTSYNNLVSILIIISVVFGVLVLFHIIMDVMKKRSILIHVRLTASLILIFNPLLLYFPKAYWLMIVFYVFCGILLGIYGYFTFYRGERHGLLYVYGSILFIIIAPIIALAITILYFEYIKDETIYRHAYYGWVSCHLPAGPTPVDLFGEKEIQYPALFSLGYLGFMGILSKIRKSYLQKKLKKNGTIPDEFDKIINSEED